MVGPRLLNTNGTLQRIGDPFTGVRAYTGNANLHTRQQLNYTGPAACATCATGLNVMDPARIDPIAKRILAMMPMPTLEGTGAGGFSNNWSRRETTDTRRNNFDAKVNLNRTNAHKMWFKLSYMYADVPDLWYFPAPEVGGTNEIPALREEAAHPATAVFESRRRTRHREGNV